MLLSCCGVVLCYVVVGMLMCCRCRVVLLVACDCVCCVCCYGRCVCVICVFSVVAGNGRCCFNVYWHRLLFVLFFCLCVLALFGICYLLFVCVFDVCSCVLLFDLLCWLVLFVLCCYVVGCC